MGCAGSQCLLFIQQEEDYEKSSKNLNNYTQILQKMNQEINSIPSIKKQNLNYSDYQGFITKSKEQGKTDYPSAFKFIKIQPISDDNLIKMKKEEIPPLCCTRRQLIDISCEMVMGNSFSKSNLALQNVKELITEIAHNYNSVSYHNFSHGFSLMQMLYRCFKLDDFLRKTYSDEELTYYLVAGITHDVNHPGTNNLFEVNMKSQLAKTAENDAVLEKMHLHTFLTICKSKPEFDIISKSSNPQKTKQKITRAILATDMAKHFKNLDIIQKHREHNTLNFQDDQIKIQMMQNLVHACDIGNSLLDFEEYSTWGGLLTFQFNQQTKLQEKNNIKVTQFLKYKGLNGFYDDQIGFLSKFVIPLWKQINVSFPKIKKMVDQSERNLQKIKQLKQKQGK